MPSGLHRIVLKPEGVCVCVTRLTEGAAQERRANFAQTNVERQQIHRTRGVRPRLGDLRVVPRDVTRGCRAAVQQVSGKLRRTRFRLPVASRHLAPRLWLPLGRSVRQPAVHPRLTALVPADRPRARRRCVRYAAAAHLQRESCTACSVGRRRSSHGGSARGVDGAHAVPAAVRGGGAVQDERGLHAPHVLVRARLPPAASRAECANRPPRAWPPRARHTRGALDHPGDGGADPAAAVALPAPRRRLRRGLPLGDRYHAASERHRLLRGADAATDAAPG
eukprot:4053678-Prymnesium_polylepis.1